MSYVHRNSLEDIRTTLDFRIERHLPKDKESAHYGEFSTLELLLNSLDLSARLFTEEPTLEEFYLRSSHFLSDLIDKMPRIQPGGTLSDNVFQYLAEEDQLYPSDGIFVYGSKNLDRAKEAAKLYLAHFGKWIYCSGSRPVEDREREHEGRTFRKFILENYDIPPQAVISDPNEDSLTMADNVRGFLNYLDRSNIALHSLILVTTAHNLRRGWAQLMKYTTDVSLVRRSSGFYSGVEKDDWFKSELGIKLIYEEFEKIRVGQILNTL